MKAFKYIILIFTLIPAAFFPHAFAYAEDDFIKWIDFKPTVEVLSQAYKYDCSSFGQDIKLNWIELLAYTACKNGNKFISKKSMEMDKLVVRLNNGENMEDITKDLKYYGFYKKGYTAILSEYVGEYIANEKLNYGLKVFCPLAKNYWFSHYRDFGNGRSYGYRRHHLGNDLLGSIGTPIVAVEGGFVEELGWNSYGGWRIGISSFDRKRYYYYAHLKKDTPYVEGLERGQKVEAGQHIGYLGNTGYSSKENVNMKSGKPHLHFGIQVIFDESQRTGAKEIWIDPYHLVEFLKNNKKLIEN